MSWAFSALLSHTQHTRDLWVYWRYTVGHLCLHTNLLELYELSLVFQLLPSFRYLLFAGFHIFHQASAQTHIKNKQLWFTRTMNYTESVALSCSVHLYHCRTAEIKVHVCSVNINCCVKYLTSSCLWATSLFRSSCLSCRALDLLSSSWKRHHCFEHSIKNIMDLFALTGITPIWSQLLLFAICFNYTLLKSVYAPPNATFPLHCVDSIQLLCRL